jgi:N utilization substance protein A
LVSRKIKVVEKTVVKQPRHELLQVADSVAAEKGLDITEVLSAMEGAIQRTAKIKYGADHNIRAIIDRETGEIKVLRVVTVVDVVENEATEISLEEAKTVQPDAELGCEFTEDLPQFDFGRSAAQGARQVIVQKIREAEREHQYVEFVERKGEIVSGIIKQVDYAQTIVDIGGTDGVIKKENNIPRQTFRIGDRIKALLIDIHPESAGPMLILSRTHNDFIKKLLEQEVTEVYDGTIKIMAVARDSGSRAKVAVYSADQRIDAVGSCVGVRGSRIQAVISELQGEKIDVIPWSSDAATYVMNALSLQEIKRVVIDEDSGEIMVVVADESLSQAIGRRGQNVRLASMLTKWRISVSSETDDAAKRAIENSTRATALINTLEIDEIMAQLLIAEGFVSVEDIAQSDLEEFTSIEGFDEDTAKELQHRAIKFVEEQEEKFFNMCKDLGVGDDLLTLEGLDIQMFMKLIDSGIRTREDIADLSSDELLDIVGKNLLSLDAAGKIVMDARKSWFEKASSDVGL